MISLVIRWDCLALCPSVPILCPRLPDRWLCWLPYNLLRTGCVPEPGRSRLRVPQTFPATCGVAPKTVGAAAGVFASCEGADSERPQLHTGLAGRPAKRVHSNVHPDQYATDDGIRYNVRFDAIGRVWFGYCDNAYYGPAALSRDDVKLAIERHLIPADCDGLDAWAPTTSTAS
jgi:hypothetical protein